MDELLALFDATPGDDNSNNHLESPQNDLTKYPLARQAQPSRVEETLAEKLAASADDKIGIRMINRKVSGSELMDMIAENSFYSPASLSAMSLAQLNQLLCDPAAVVDKNTVCGRTQLLTIGLIFSNTGTRMASSGNAYCALTVGNIRSGPCLSILLFGSAYSKFCRPAQPGKVVALTHPRLVPAKENAQHQETSVTLSINDERQLLLVADAKDYGVCKGTCRYKRAGDGELVSKPCKHHVDKRVSEYCSTHRNMGKMKSDGTAGKVKGPATLLERLRHERQTQSTMVSPGIATIRTSRTNQSRQDITLSGTTPLYQSRPISKVTPAVTRAGPLRSLQAQEKKTMGPPRTNPYSTAARVTPPSRPEPVRSKLLSAQVPEQVTGDWLGEGIRKAPCRKPEIVSGARKRPKLNTDTVQFNGSVSIPQPKLLVNSHTRMLPSQRPDEVDANVEKKEADIRAKQKEVATSLQEQRQQLKAVSSSGRDRLSKGGGQTFDRRSDERENLGNTLFSSLKDVDLDEVASKKSRFADEIEAEEYARSRNIVTELEKKERVNDSRPAKKKASTQGNIHKEWMCRTCNRTFSSRPNKCFSLDHQVQTRRTLKEAKTLAERRLDLSHKSEDDGGLKLASGLDWSRYQRFS